MDKRVLHQRREQADEWITYASWTAMGTAALGIVFVLTIGFSDFETVPATIPLLSSLTAQALIGYQFRATRSQWAAWGLMITYLAAAILHILEAGLWSGILIKAAIAFVYIKGFLASFAYAELDEQIRSTAIQP